jgi:hypothetical protein
VFEDDGPIIGLEPICPTHTLSISTLHSFSICPSPLALILRRDWYPSRVNLEALV